jgi:hypothetical protein
MRVSLLLSPSSYLKLAQTSNSNRSVDGISITLKTIFQKFLDIDLFLFTLRRVNT